MAKMGGFRRAQVLLFKGRGNDVGGTAEGGFDRRETGGEEVIARDTVERERERVNEYARRIDGRRNS